MQHINDVPIPNAIKTIEGLIDDVKKFYDHFDSDFYSRWSKKTECIIASIYGDKAGHYLEIRHSLSEVHINDHMRHDIVKPLNELRGDLEGILESLRMKVCDEEDGQHGLNILTTTFRNFHRFARQLKDRHASRPSLVIEDEYDVQDLVHALLLLHFKDVRTEEYTPSYAGSASRIDFLLKDEKIAIEIKMTRDGLTDKKLGEELMIDTDRYQTHPDCKTLVCFIYDPKEYIKNPTALENDLSGEKDNLNVVAIISPQI